MIYRSADDVDGREKIFNSSKQYKGLKDRTLIILKNYRMIIVGKHKSGELQLKLLNKEEIRENHVSER